MKKVLLLFMALMFSILTWGQTYFTESFEGAWSGTPAAPSGWIQTHPSGSDTEAWEQSVWTTVWTPAGNGTKPTGTPYGSSVAHFNDYNSAAGNVFRVESSDIDLSASINPRVSLNYFYNTGSAVLRIWASNDGGGTWTNISGSIAATGANWTKFNFNLSAYKVSNARIAFEVTSAYSSHDLWLDNLIIEETPTPLAGIYTINNTLPTTATLLHDGSDNFASFSAAILALNDAGVSGSVTFNVTAGQTFAENTPIITATGTVANTITFVKSGAGANPVITPSGTAGTTDAGITIAGGDYITFDGIDINASAVSAVEYGYFVRNNPSGIDGAQYNVIKNCSITLNRTNTSSRAIYQNVSTAPTNATGANSYNKYQNLAVSNTYSGIFLTGNSTYNDLSSEISNCTIGAASANDIGNGTSAMNGIRITSGTDISVFNNEIRNITITGGANLFGIYVESIKGTANNIYNNKIHDLTSTSTSTSALIYAIRTDVNASMVCNVFNNMIYGLQHAISTTTTTFVIRGISIGISGAGTGNFYYNSVRIDEDANPSSQCFYINAGTANLKNNVFANFSTGGATSKRYCIYRNGGTLTNVDNNNYYVAAGTNNFVGYFTTDQATLANWQTASSKDANSKSVDPMFAGTSDLHSASADLNAAGVVISLANGDALDITTDIDGDLRNVTTPDMGADEFDPPSCIFPTALAYSAVTNNSATISWTASTSNPANGYDIYYSTSATAPDGATVPTASVLAGVTTYGMTSLSANTTYYVWVRSNCGAGDLSTWVGPLSFTTLCNSTAIPYSQDFESAIVPGFPSCTAIQNAGTGNNWITANNPGSGFTSKTLRYTYNTTNAANAWFYTQGIDLVAGTSYRLTFRYGNNGGATYVERLKVSYGTSAVNTDMTNLIVDYPSVTNSTPNVSTTDFTPSVTGTYYLGFNCYSIADRNALFVDDILLEPTPSCLAPTALTSSAITSNSATISWTASASAPANGYDYYVATTTTAPDGATVPTGSVAAGVTTANLSSLSANTTYYFWVRSNCDGTNYSAWAGYGSFFTGYCSSTSTGSGYYITNFVTTGGDNNISNNSAGYSATGYGNFTAMSVSSFVEAPVNYTATWNTTGGVGYGLWIDWNNDLDFADANETVYLTGAYNFTDSYSGTITIPVGTPIGSYRMRTKIDYNSTAPTSCGSITSGETEDYTFEVIATPICYNMPTTLVASALTTTTATVSWTAPSTPPANGYQYYLATTAAPVPDGATIPTGVTAAGVTSVDLSLLTDNTSYYIWVRANCDDVNFSGWAGSLNFTTLANCVVPTALVSSAVTATTATVSWTASISAPANGYEYYVSTTALPVPDGATVPTGVTLAGITSVDLSSLTQNTAYYVWVRANCDGINFSDWAGALNFTTPFTCPAPSALSVSNILSTSVQINWTESGAATAWNFKASTVNFDPTIANGDFGLIPVGTNPYTTPAILTPNTLYYYYIQANCGVGDESTWVAGTFTTACGSISSFPYTETFESLTTPAIPTCWSRLNVDGGGSQWASSTAYNHTTAGSKSMVHVYSSAAYQEGWFISPAFEIPATGVYQLSFWSYNVYPGDYEKNSVLISTTGTNTTDFTEIWSPASVSATWVETVINLSSYAGETVYFAFKYEGNNAHSWHVDDLTIRGLSAENDILTFSFTEQTGPATIDAGTHTVAIEVGGAVNLNGLVPTITVSPNAAINPLSGVAQDFSAPFNYTVTAENSDAQVWTVTVTNAITLSSANDITSFSFALQTGPATIDAGAHTVAIEVAWTANLTNLVPTIGVSPLATINPATGVAQNFSAPFNYTVTAENSDEQIWTINVTQQATPAGATCATAIDYGTVNDPEMTGTMTAYEVVWYKFTTAQPFANVDIHTCGSDFDTKIAIFADCADFTSIPEFGAPANNMGYNDDATGGYCSVANNQSLVEYAVLPAGTYYIALYPYSTGTTLGNYAIRILGDPDACLAPTALAYTDLQQEEVTLTWNAGFTETEWNLIYGAAGFDPLTEGTTLNNVTTPYNLTGLTENTSYDVYVQAICSGPSTSAWSTVFNFTTLAGCPVPTDLSETVTATSATLSWNAWGTTAWNLVASTSTFDPTVSTGDFGLIPVTTNPFISGDMLTPNTTYYYYLQADCGAGVTSAWSAQGTFTTECASVELFTENFDAVTSPALPSCWAKYVSPSYTFETVNTYTTAPYSAPNCVQLYSSGATAAIDAPLLITNQVSNLNSGTKQLRFFAKGASSNTSVIVGTMSDPMDAATFVPYQTVTGLSTAAWNEYTISFASYVGTDEYIAFAHPLTTTYSYMYLDNIVLELIPACPTPQSLVGNTVSPTSEMLNWTESGSATEWNVAVSTTPIDPAVGPYAFNFTTTDNPHLLEGLTSSTTYYFYVQADCGGDVSAWSSAGTFTTPCSAVTALPWTESFETTSAGAITNCWFKENGDWIVTNNANSTYDADARTGAMFLRDSWSATNEYIWTVGFDLTAGTSYEFSFWWAGDGYSNWTGDVFYNTAQNSTGATQIGSSFVASTTTTTLNYAQVVKTFVPATDGTYYFAIRVNCPSSSPWYISFDDFKLDLTPACPTPSDLFVTNITTTGAILNWTENGSSTTWNLKASTTPFDPETEPGMFPPTSTGTNPFLIPGGLTPSTTYYWAVQSDCGGDVSAWSAVGTFTTACSAFTTFPYFEGFEDATFAPNCWTNDTWVQSLWGTAHTGNEFAYTNLAGSTLTTPEFEIPATGNYILSYWYRTESEDYGDPQDFQALLSTDGINFTTTIQDLNDYTVDVYQKLTFDLSAYSNQSIWIKFIGMTGIGGSDYGFLVDDFEIREMSDENDILTFSFTQATGPAVIDDLNHTVTIEVAMGTNLVGLVPTFTISDYATVDYASGNPQDFTAPFTYTVTSEMGNDQAWVVTVTTATALQTANDILTFTLPTQTGPATIDAGNHTVAIEVAWNTVLTSLTPTITISPLATINPLSATAQDFSAPFTYTVTAEDITYVQDWVVTVTNGAIPEGATCADPINYGLINDPAMTNVLPAGENWWYMFTLDGTYENVLVSTCGTDFDNKLAVYTDCSEFQGGYGNTIGIAPGSIGYDDDDCIGGEFVTGSAAAATHTFASLDAGTYYVVVYGYGATSAGNTRLEITGTLVVNPQINVIDLNSVVEDIAICEGVDVGTVIGQLAQQIVITDTDDTQYTRDLVWNIAGYDANTPADYTATGTFTLPAGVDQTDPATVLEVTATVTVDATTTPTFSFTTTYCEGETVDALPLTSDNGVTGTWAPATISTAVGTADYTFTPDGAICSEPVTISVTVNAPTTPAFSFATTYCLSDAADVLPLTSDNGVTGTWAPATIDTDIEGATNYVFTQDAGQCAIGATVAVTVNAPTTVATFSFDTEYCIGSTPDALPLISDNGIAGTWLPATINTAAAGDVDYVFTPDAGECGVGTTISVTVNDLPVVTCPGNMAMTSADGVTTLTGATPAGGVYSGTNVTGDQFDPTGLPLGAYTITYTYTDPTTGCVNSCDFTIDIVVNIINTEVASIAIYPNPNNGIFTLNFSNVNGEVNYQIYDTKGSIIVDENIMTSGNTVKEVELNLVPGVYYVKLITNAQTVVEKLVIE